MITFLIVATSLYTLLASSVAQLARSHDWAPLQWFLLALAIKPVIEQLLSLSLSLSRTEGSRHANPDAVAVPDQGSLFGAASGSAL